MALDGHALDTTLCQCNLSLGTNFNFKLVIGLNHWPSLLVSICGLRDEFCTEIKFRNYVTYKVNSYRNYR